MIGNSIEVVLFDAVGTVMYPQPGIAEAYVEIGSRYIEDLSTEKVLARFKTVFASIFSAENASQPVTEASTVDAWRRVVQGTFPEYDDVGGELFQQLWDHFAASSSWGVYEDVAGCFDRVLAAGYQIGIASNFDSRLEKIVENDPVLSQAHHVFHSAQLGWNKPASGFCDGITNCLGVAASNIVLIGDRIDNDIQPALAAGWQGIWLDRDEVGSAESLPFQRISGLGELL